MRTRTLVSFGAGVLVVVALNLYDLYRPRGVFVYDASMRVGIPFEFYAYGGYAGSTMNGSGLVADAIVAVGVGFLFVLISRGSGSWRMATPTDNH